MTGKLNETAEDDPGPGAGDGRAFLLLSDRTSRHLVARIETSDYLRGYWNQIVLPGLEAELTKDPPGSPVRMAFAWRMTGQEVYAQAAWKALSGSLQNNPTNMLHKGSRIIELATALSWLKDSPGASDDSIARAEELMADIVETTFASSTPTPTRDTSCFTRGRTPRTSR